MTSRIFHSYVSPFPLVFGGLNQIRIAQLLKVLVLVPELVIEFGLVTGDFVEDSQVSRVILCAELTGNLL